MITCTSYSWSETGKTGVQFLGAAWCFHVAVLLNHLIPEDEWSLWIRDCGKGIILYDLLFILRFLLV